MSRLYVTKTTDMSKSGSRARTKATAEIRWGSRGDSKLAARLEVTWDKNEDVPRIKIIYGETWAGALLEEIVFNDG